MEEAAEMPFADAYARITAMRGVGAWTAGTVGLVALGDPDAIPVGDYHLPNTIAYALVGEEAPTTTACSNSSKSSAPTAAESYNSSERRM